MRRMLKCGSNRSCKKWNWSRQPMWCITDLRKLFPGTLGSSCSRRNRASLISPWYAVASSALPRMEDIRRTVGSARRISLTTEFRPSHAAATNVFSSRVGLR